MMITIWCLQVGHLLTDRPRQFAVASFVYHTLADKAWRDGTYLTLI